MLYYNSNELTFELIILYATTQLLFEAEGEEANTENNKDLATKIDSIKKKFDKLDEDKADEFIKKFINKLLKKDNADEGSELDKLPEGKTLESWAEDAKYGDEFTVSVILQTVHDALDTYKSSEELINAYKLNFNSDAALKEINELLKNNNLLEIQDLNEFLSKTIVEQAKSLGDDEKLANNAIVTIYNPEKCKELFNYINKILNPENETQN